MKFFKIFSLALLSIVFAEANVAQANNSICRCTPDQACWPNLKEWQEFSKSLTGKLVVPESPIEACKKDIDSEICKADLNKVKNPFYMQSKPGNTESQGWLGAWDAKQSTYAVEIANTQDIVKSINFARNHNLRVVIKGAGHDYLGRSNAPDSLLIWTHNMRDTSYDENFIPEGCDSSQGNPAVTVSAGTRWLEAYTEATTKHNMYVQGGGCTTVGAAGGFPQGGGFGSWSKEFGTGAAGILQATVVTADGKVVVVNKCQNPDLFYAIRGGGAGTYGVVSNLTLLAHPLPKYFGVLQGKITAKDDKSYQALIKHFLAFFEKNLNNQNWGEQFKFMPNNTIEIFMTSQGIDEKQAKETWEPLVKWIDANEDYKFDYKYINVPPKDIWNYDYWEKNHPEFVTKNEGANARPGEYWWSGNTGEVYNYWYTYQSWWLPEKVFEKDDLDSTAKTIYDASRITTVAFHINKGLAGASKDAITRGKETSTNPTVYDAATLVLMSAGTNNIFGDRNTPKAQKQVQDINKAMSMIKSLAPNAGTYVNEADYFEPNWQQAFWGDNYSKLFQIKQKYDPNGLFYCHHCVGSESWQEGGMCKK
ncbi:FAD-binding protein [Pseudofrancisella aestuarii]|uniref:FAD-binding protein n=1 Tax=Pseudofrancisella aestuarii TaxID=2670347 RepID=A0ABV9TAE9_9GAMM|nr:FAD-binding protein [Pseudofrancisella aestuarii]